MLTFTIKGKKIKLSLQFTVYKYPYKWYLINRYMYANLRQPKMGKINSLKANLKVH